MEGKVSEEIVSYLQEKLEISPQLANKLIDKGYRSLEAIAISHPLSLEEEIEIPANQAEKLIFNSREYLNNKIEPRNALELLEEERERIKITTGSHDLDSLLDGGIWVGEITEFAGSFGTGKTQLCFQLSVTTQLPKELGGAEGKVFYIDSEKTFSSKRVMEISLAFDLDPMSVLKNILVAKAFDAKNQMDLVKEVANIAKKENIKLLIIDSFATHFRSEFLGKDKLVERQQKIMFHAAQLSNLAALLDIAVVVTNQIIANMDDFSMGGAQPALGFAWAHRPQQRILLRRYKGTARVARLLDSPRSAEYEAVFYITRDGIKDRSTPNY